ncbi:MAG TPA: radical SAM protein, partial [Kofleriaceae bacterium]|nr:radical SAM protein [Kofleriaceae bacterium]
MSKVSLFLQLARCALLEPHRPVLANLVVTRRCNLSCGYCHEYDQVSPPVPTEVLRERIDHLARLRTVLVTLTGGETLLHPDIAALVAHVGARGMTALLNTNGFLLTRGRIDALNDAGLFGMQLSIDGVRPTAVSRKAFKTLLPKLELLAEHARFRVRVNTVLGACPPEEAVAVARAVNALGLEAKCSLARDQAGALLPVDDAGRAAYDEIRSLERDVSSYLSEDFQVTLLRQGRVDWKCRAGARYFHVSEDGLVQYCPAHAGRGGIPLADFGEA